MVWFTFLIPPLAIAVVIWLMSRSHSADVMKRLERYIHLKTTQMEAQKKSKNIYAAIDKRMDKVPVLKTAFNGIERLLTVANVPVKTSEFLIIILVTMIVVLALQVFLTGGMGMASFGAIMGSIVMPFVILQIRIQLRLAKLRGQLKLCISLLANSMKAGNSFIQALRHITADLHEPLAGEFRLLLNENGLGIPLDAALNNMGRRVPCNEMRALVRGVILQQQTGSNLVAILNSIFNTLQDRDELRNKITTMTLPGKISGGACIMVPFGLFMIMSKAQEGYSEVLLHSHMGHMLILACFVLMVVGSFFIYKIVSFKF